MYDSRKKIKFYFKLGRWKGCWSGNCKVKIMMFFFYLRLCKVKLIGKYVCRMRVSIIDYKRIKYGKFLFLLKVVCWDVGLLIGFSLF